jgi:RNA polymerase sigma factor (sigma-70 family)
VVAAFLSLLFDETDAGDSPNDTGAQIEKKLEKLAALPLYGCRRETCGAISMAGEQLHTVIEHLRRVVYFDSGSVLSDAALLERFLASRDQAAFELLMWRHGAMVWGLCRRILRQPQDAEDAFQATFLALVRKSGDISKRESLGSWLYKVAYRIALHVKGTSAKRRARELPLRNLTAAAPEPAPGIAELWPLLDAEVHRLPDKYRIPFVLCYLEGKTLQAAAQQLGCPSGTVGSRLARAKERLRHRLSHLGLALTAAAFTAALSYQTAHAGVEAQLLAVTARAATLLANGRPVTGVISTKVLALTERVVHTMFLTKMKAVTTAVLAMAAFCVGIGVWTYQMYAADDTTAQQAAVPAKLAQADQPNKLPPQGLDATPGLVARTEVNLGKDKEKTLKGWGKTIDPDGDSKLNLDQGKLTIKIPGSDHALCIERDKMNAPRVLQEIEGDFIVQVKLTGDYPQGATSVVQGRLPFHGAGLLLWQDEKNYVRLECAELVSQNQNVRYASWELRQDGKFERTGNTGDLRLTEKEYYLRLERRDGKLYAAFSADGVRWESLPPINVELPNRLQVGIVAGHNTSSAFEVHFSEFRLFRAAAK